jgi:very-short-patch-repair endonuclease
MRLSLTPFEKQVAHWLKELHIPCKKQEIVFPYIADFLCKNRLLIIEIDGKQHYTDEGMRKDAIRTNHFEQAGFSVIRFPNESVTKELLWNEIKKYKIVNRREVLKRIWYAKVLSKYWKRNTVGQTRRYLINTT